MLNLETCYTALTRELEQSTVDKMESQRQSQLTNIVLIYMMDDVRCHLVHHLTYTFAFAAVAISAIVTAAQQSSTSQ